MAPSSCSEVDLAYIHVSFTASDIHIRLLESDETELQQAANTINASVECVIWAWDIMIPYIHI